jgi:hypothetical protein
MLAQHFSDIIAQRLQFSNTALNKLIECKCFANFQLMQFRNLVRVKQFLHLNIPQHPLQSRPHLGLTWNIPAQQLQSNCFLSLWNGNEQWQVISPLLVNLVMTFSRLMLLIEQEWRGLRLQRVEE